MQIVQFMAIVKNTEWISSYPIVFNQRFLSIGVENWLVIRVKIALEIIVWVGICAIFRSRLYVISFLHLYLFSFIKLPEGIADLHCM